MILKFTKMFKWGDILISLFLFAGVFLSIPLMIKNKPQSVEIYRDNEKLAEYPLYTDRDISIQGALGTLKIRIKHNKVEIISSNCPHHLCMKSSAISYPNAQIVCAPNHILVTIKSSKKETVLDGIAR